MTEQEETARIFVSLLSTAASRSVLRFSRHLQKMSMSCLLGEVQRLKKTGRAESQRLYERAGCIREYCRRHAVQIVHREHAAYPALLREVYDPPYLLYVLGTLPDERSIPTVGIAGTRQATALGRYKAFSLGLEAAKTGIPLVFGLVRGIESSAALGVAAAQGRAWAVTGSGFENVYPRSSMLLVKELVYHGGGVISEYPPDQKPLKWFFPARNRIISGMSQLLFVIEAARGSRALMTVEFALDQGREVCVDADCLRSGASEGTVSLYEEGAPAHSSLADIVKDSHRAQPCERSSYSRSQLVMKAVTRSVYPFGSSWLKVE
ncbi:MAG: DNA-processing protein DprA [Spirochaetota bacterium]